MSTMLAHVNLSVNAILAQMKSALQHKNSNYAI
jgi:hypothetical protein